jgi:hypothetical protein
MKISLVKTLAAIGMAAAAATSQAQVHGHLNVGAVSTARNAQLIWDNGADFIASSDFVSTFYPSNSGRFAGFYNGNITLTALAATSANGGPAPNAPALGSYIQFKMSCLEGPSSGTFGFWDAGSTAPSISLAPGQSSSVLWRLSEGDGSPGSDPYGHIHGRRFSATKPGIYKIAFTAVDTSTNGTSGGPIHTPSAQLPVYFEAGMNLRSIAMAANGTRVKFAAPANFAWQLQSCGVVKTGAVWISTGAPVTGDDYFHEVTDQTPGGTNRFYRVLGTPIQP